MNTTQIQQLAKRFFSTTIHGITGQEVNEGWLEAGTLIRNLKTWEVGGYELGEIVTKCSFESSTDGGATWHKETSLGVPEVRPWIKLVKTDGQRRGGGIAAVNPPLSHNTHVLDGNPRAGWSILVDYAGGEFLSRKDFDKSKLLDALKYFRQLNGEIV